MALLVRETKFFFGFFPQFKIALLTYIGIAKYCLGIISAGIVGIGTLYCRLGWYLYIAGIPGITTGISYYWCCYIAGILYCLVYLVLQLVYHIAGIAGVGILLVNCLVGIAWYTWYCWYCRHTWYYSWYIILLVLVYCLYIVLPVLPGIPGIAGVIRCDSRTSP